jgi:hypothetical protein
MPIAIIIAIILAGGASITANNALPGDMLYGVKVGVNENVEKAFSLSAEAKARTAEKHAEERLEEAEKLSAEGKLTADVKADLVTKFNAQAETLRQHLADLSADGKATVAAEIHSDFDHRMNTRIEAIGRSDSNAAEFVNSLNGSLNANANARLNANVNANLNATSSSNTGTSTNNGSNGAASSSNSGRGSVNISL